MSSAIVIHTERNMGTTTMPVSAKPRIRNLTVPAREGPDGRPAALHYDSYMTDECRKRSVDPTEHRWGTRVALPIAVKLVGDGRTLGQGVMRDVSVSGGFIDTPVKLPVFTNLVVSLQTPGATLGAPPDLAACVVRNEPAGFAVEWRDMACETLVALLGLAGAECAPQAERDRAFG